MTDTTDIATLKWTLHLTTIALGVGLFAPCMTIQPGFGDLTGILKLLKPDLVKPIQYSILGGIKKLFINGNIGMGLIVFLFSVAFPIGKLCLFYSYAYALTDGAAKSRLLSIAQNTSKFGMLDIFVAALYTIVAVTLPGGTQVKVHWVGVGSFVLAVILSIVISIWIKHRDS